MRGRDAALAWVAAGFAGGIVLGLVAWTRYQDRHSQSLFSDKTRRRFAALSRLSSEATVDTVALLREYVAWERHPLLRRRGEEILGRLVAALR